MSDVVFLTGGSGFVGGHVLRELLAAGYSVRALSRTPTLPRHPDPTCHPELVEGRPEPVEGRAEIVVGDLRRPGEFAQAMRGCRYVVHCAALYSFSPRDRKVVHDVNVVGTAGVVEAAHIAGVERVVLTSSSATLGASRNAVPLREDDYAPDGPHAGYHHSKVEQERAAFAGRVPVVALLPTAPVGPGDWKPTPTGQMILDFARGKMFSKPPRGGMNLVPVEDVARAHVAALQRGVAGERYIVGSENMLLDDLWQMLSDVTGVAVPRWRAPYALMLAVAYADEARCRVQPAAQPFVPLEGVRMARDCMFADSSKAQRELGVRSGSVRDALERSVHWYREHGYVTS